MRWTVDSETGVLTDVLLCPPDHYRWLETNAVAVSTLASSAQFNRAEMLRQWDGLLEAITAAGVRPHFLTPSPAHPYQVYTRDSSQTTPWGPVLTQLALPQRRGEYAAVLDFHLAADGFYRFGSEGVFEGGDIHIVRPGLMIIGHSGVRTNRQGAEQFAGWFAAQGWKNSPNISSTSTCCSAWRPTVWPWPVSMCWARISRGFWRRMASTLSRQAIPKSWR